jgi:hypothetical protein
MTEVLKKFIEFGKIILTIIGIISPYPRVNIEQVYVYRDFKNPSNIRSQIRFANLLNNSIIEIITNGTDIEIECFVYTTVEKKEIISKKITKKVTYRNNSFFVDSLKFKEIKLLSQWLDVFDFVVLTNAGYFRKKEVLTEISLSLKSDLDVNLELLWGNKPKIVLTYLIEDRDEN